MDNFTINATINSLNKEVRMLLPELVDKGFNVSSYYEKGNRFSININNKGKYEWDSVKYDIIPFVEYISSKYKVLNIGFTYFYSSFNSYYKEYTVKEILDDNDILSNFNFININLVKGIPRKY